MRSPETGPTTVGWLWWERTLVWGGFVLVGGLVGWAVPLLVALLARLPVGPGDLAQRLLDAAPEGWTTPGCVGLGALLGAGLAAVGEYEALRVSVTREEVVLRAKDRVTRVGRPEAAHVFVAAKRLVVLGPDGREAAAEVTDLNVARLAAAFEAAGWPWRADDPFAGEFALWTAGASPTPEGTSALLVARQRALDTKDTAEADLLRAELNRLGVVVRDEKRRQYWRAARTQG